METATEEVLFVDAVAAADADADDDEGTSRVEDGSGGGSVVEVVVVVGCCCCCCWGWRNKSPRIHTSAWITDLPPTMIRCVPTAWARRETLLPVSYVMR